jgi:hypothetical protein
MLLRLVATLLAVQAIISVFLVLKLNTIESRLGAFTANEIPQQVKQDSALPPPAPTDIQEKHLTAQNLRSILRQELKQWVNRPTADSTNENPDISSVTVAQAEAQQQMQQLLESYIDQGEIRYSDLETFSASLKDLRAEERKQALRQLTATINSGLISISH